MYKRQGKTDPVNIVQLEGTTGSAPAIDRATGFADAIKADSNMKVVASQTGDFTRAGGKQVMEAMLKSQKDIDVVYAHNDDMGPVSYTHLTYYLTCPRATSMCSTLEAQGVMAEFTERLAVDADLATAYARAHAALSLIHI